MTERRTTTQPLNPSRLRYVGRARSALRRRLAAAAGADAGMSTVEYAVGMVLL